MISPETATDIAALYRDIRAAEELLEKVKQAIEKMGEADIRDVFGRRARNIEMSMSIPQDDRSSRILAVPYDLAVPVIEATIASHKAKISALCVKAKAELAGVPEPVAAEPSLEWGDPIPVDGKRPEWLRDDEYVTLHWGKYGGHRGWSTLNYGSWNVAFFDNDDWQKVDLFRLPASHPYYLATSRGFRYWPGGDKAPTDWDGDRRAVILRNGEIEGNLVTSWRHLGTPVDVIGYRREPNADPV